MTQVHFYDQTCVHVDGYRQIVSFDTTQVLLRCKKNMLVIEGNALRIASFDGAEITVRGDIAAVRWKVEEAPLCHSYNRLGGRTLFEHL